MIETASPSIMLPPTMAPTNVVINQQPFPVTFSPHKPLKKNYGQRGKPERQVALESKCSNPDTEHLKMSKLTNRKMKDQGVGSEVDLSSLKEDEESPFSGRGESPGANSLEWQQIKFR